MARSELEDRVANLEAEVERMKKLLDHREPEVPWWRQIAGKYKDDPAFEEAMRLGREYRESLRAKPRTRRP